MTWPLHESNKYTKTGRVERPEEWPSPDRKERLKQKMLDNLKARLYLESTEETFESANEFNRLYEEYLDEEYLGDDSYNRIRYAMPKTYSITGYNKIRYVNPYKGYIDNFRISKNIARWPSVKKSLLEKIKEFFITTNVWKWILSSK